MNVVHEVFLLHSHGETGVRACPNMAPLLPPVSKQNVLACASYEAWACFELNLGTNFVESLRLRKDDVGEELWRRESGEPGESELSLLSTPLGCLGCSWRPLLTSLPLSSSNGLWM